MNRIMRNIMHLIFILILTVPVAFTITPAIFFYTKGTDINIEWCRLILDHTWGNYGGRLEDIKLYLDEWYFSALKHTAIGYIIILLITRTMKWKRKVNKIVKLYLREHGLK